ncbi:coiled-coil domain-containing protein [Paenibacillus senegalensis]|uniref:hypothetical protein n=1 Tax=Paenibacillus senegalensis TaxID=1465766 RepID=UPI000287E93C|nr:hypothetical protein [Paenibacillus senegalensis]
MRMMRTVSLVLLTLFLLLPSWLVVAEPNSSSGTGTSEAIPADSGEISSKDEVVYARLSAAGEKKEMYVVNILDIVKAGTITDHGLYSNLKNLTDLSSIVQQSDNTVVFTASEGKFYYQGTLEEQSLPWDISISYWLNDKEVTSEELAGKSGQVQIRIATSANETVDPVFFENYLLQISLSLDQDKFTNIQVSDGMIANAGKNQQITFTVLPEQEKELIVEAEAAEFELEGIDIAGIPSTMPIDAPDIDDMVEDMDTLTNAIAEIHGGLGDLLDGINQLNSGARELRNGSKQYEDGIAALHTSSAELLSGSASIRDALTRLNQSLSGGLDEVNPGDLQQLEDGLRQIAYGLQEIPKGIGTLDGQYGSAYTTLNNAIHNIPEHNISEAQIQQLYSSGADRSTIDQLLETYSAAREAKSTYTAVKPGLEAVSGTLAQISASLTDMADQLIFMADGISSSQADMDAAGSLAELQQGISAISLHYQQFQAGLEQYTAGVAQLDDSYHQLHQGIEELTTGTGQLREGAAQLHDGTGELSSSTRNLPDQMRAEASQMIADYDKSDFEAVSFVSPHNANINSVQFVLRTESIKQEVPEAADSPIEQKEGFWARFVNLFRFNE